MASIRTCVRGAGVRLLAAGGLVASACAFAASVASAGPATYYASPSSTDTSGSCTSSAPCRLDHAISLAASGDVVVVLPGTYSINYTLATSLPVTIEGQPGQPRPSLVASQDLRNDTLSVSGGAVVRHLEIQTNSGEGVATSALSIDGGTAEDLVLKSGSEDENGTALVVKDSSSGTIVRTVLAVNKAQGGVAVSFADSATAPGTANVYNLTAVSTGENSEALSGNVATGTVWIKNSIVHGPSDISTKPGTQALNLTYSAFRASNSAGYVDQGGNVLSAPVFVNAGSGDYHDYHEAETSPTIDAGAPDPALTTTDLDGHPRVFGSAPDMGAYEYDGAPQSGGSSDGTELPDDTSTQLPPASTPIPGASVVLNHASGTVRVQLPGHTRFIRLNRDADVPVGSVVDVTHGAVVLTSAVNRTGASKSGLFRAGRFLVTQSTDAHPATKLRLLGGRFAECLSSAGLAHDGPPMARIARTRPRRHHVVRQLWGSDSGGSFVTIGSTASAAVRGTVWLTQDRCDGTLVRVLRGAVLVHDDALERNVLVHRGHSYLARAHG